MRRDDKPPKRREYPFITMGSTSYDCVSEPWPLSTLRRKIKSPRSNSHWSECRRSFLSVTLLLWNFFTCNGYRNDFVMLCISAIFKFVCSFRFDAHNLVRAYTIISGEKTCHEQVSVFDSNVTGGQPIDFFLNGLSCFDSQVCLNSLFT